jgi:hypothetical protein
MARLERRFVSAGLGQSLAFGTEPSCWKQKKNVLLEATAVTRKTSSGLVQWPSVKKQ